MSMLLMLDGILLRWVSYAAQQVFDRSRCTSAPDLLSAVCVTPAADSALT